MHETEAQSFDGGRCGSVTYQIKDQKTKQIRLEIFDLSTNSPLATAICEEINRLQGILDHPEGIHIKTRDSRGHHKSKRTIEEQKLGKIKSTNLSLKALKGELQSPLSIYLDESQNLVYKIYPQENFGY